MGVSTSGQPAGESETLDIPNVEITSTTSAVSEVPAATPTLDKATLKQLVGLLSPVMEAKLRESLKPDMEKVVQSAKDVRWTGAAPLLDKLKGLDLEAIQAVGELLKQAGGNAEAVEQNLALREFMATRKSTAQEPTPERSSKVESGTRSSDMQEAIIEALKPFNLPTADAQAVLDEWGKAKTYTSLPLALAALNALVAGKVTGASAAAGSATSTTPASTGAGVIAPAGGTIGTMSDGDREAAKAELRAKLQGEYFKAPSKFAKEIDEAKAKLKELGDPLFA